MRTLTRDVTKLPKWAQDEIARLTGNVAYWKQKAEAGPENADTFVDSHFDSPGKPLGQSPRISFRLDPEDWQETIEVYREGDGVVVRSPLCINVQPQSGNVCRVETRSR